MLIEDEHFYNNSYVVVDDVIKFERVYMVDEYKFNNKTYEDLSKIYKILPFYIGNQITGPC